MRLGTAVAAAWILRGNVLMKILLVDDSVDLLTVFEVILGDLTAHELRTATSGEDALELAA
jgi:CheY-like chemotaxis protein